jgi:alkylated DNA repair dioxygenase AlkB
MTSAHFTAYDLGEGLAFLVGHLPDERLFTPDEFQQLWDLHPETKPTIVLHGREVMIPRWQQAYGQDYRFSGQVSSALPIPAMLMPILEWATRTIHPGLNGLLLNWYDGPGHYIGPHHDSVINMIADAPIVTISFGESRKFRLSRGREKRDFLAENGAVYVLPQDTNAVWKHAVPKSTRYAGRRISVTLRGFD